MAALLVVGVAAELIACVGILIVRGPYNGLHLTAPTVLGSFAIGLAVLVREGFSLVGDRGIEIAFIVALTSPVIVQAIAHAARFGERGSLDVHGDDVERVG